jgi:hypothetical protein
MDPEALETLSDENLIKLMRLINTQTSSLFSKSSEDMFTYHKELEGIILEKELSSLSHHQLF